MTIKPIPGADQPLTLDAIRERDRWADQVPAEGGITSAQRAMDRRWLLAEVDRLRAIEASFDRLAAEVRALQGERDDAAAARDACGMELQTCRATLAEERADVDILTAELAALRARPTLTEEQARSEEDRIYQAILDRPGKSIRGEDVRWGIREALRASCGETGPAKPGGDQWTRAEPVVAAWLDYFAAMDRQHKSASAADAQIVRELRAKANGMDRLVADVVYHVAFARHRASRGETGPAPDPRATLHAGDPASVPDPRVDYSTDMRPAVTGGECSRCLHAPPLHEATCPTLRREPRTP